MSRPSIRDVGLLTLRTALGGIMFVHGAQKLFGWFGGSGIAGTAAGWEKIGFEPGEANVIAAGLGTAGGGTLLALGLATPAAGAAVTGTMAVAADMHLPGGFFAHEGGVEYVAFLGVAATALALTGPGELSLDSLLGHRLNRPWMRNLALASVLPAAAVVIQRRRRALAAAAQPVAHHGAGPEVNGSSEWPADA
jgi:putative oxidoreductase